MLKVFNPKENKMIESTRDVLSLSLSLVDFCRRRKYFTDRLLRVFV